MATTRKNQTQKRRASSSRNARRSPAKKNQRNASR
jgi:hypothetical protein